MKRFRFTLLAVCLVLLFLGGHDIYLMLRNPAPLEISLAELTRTGPPQEWLTITDARIDLLEAISTSGTIELEAFLVPLKTDPDDKEIRVMIETRDSEIMRLLQTYYFKLESDAEREVFLEKNRNGFFPRRPITGMLVSGLIASANSDKLVGLAKDLNIPVAEDVIFMSEGKRPPRWRGLFFTLVALAGLYKTVIGWRKRPAVTD